jgi:N-acetylglucosaminyldiphosphoundecaprenol N-acetyl-beta-D-mannosaminyltransferase
MLDKDPPVASEVHIERNGAVVLRSFIDSMSWEQAISRLLDWSRSQQSRYVCICNVHSVVTAAREPAFADVINGADMATPDGMPVAWVLRRLGFSKQDRIDGPNLMWMCLAEAERLHQSVFFYGSTEHTLTKLRERALQAFPRLVIVGMESPAFIRLPIQRDDAAIEAINASGASLVFVGLGCPKQELWMATHRGHVQAVMIGVGAAFDYHAGTLKRAPLWMQRNGLEWLYRLVSEPRRLWRRYLITNFLYIVGVSKQLLFDRHS